MPRSFSGANLSDAAAFTATFSGLRSLTDGDYRISFDFPGEKFMEVAAILSQGGKPSAAKGTWFAIARLNDGGAATGNNPISQSLQLANHTSERAARTSNPLPQRAALLCNDPQFRLFLERTYLPRGNHCNDAATAAEIMRLQCEIESRAEIIPGTPAADKFDHLVANFIVWKNADRYVEAPRIQQENQA